MAYTIKDIADAEIELKKAFADLKDKKAILRAPQLRELFGKIKTAEPDKRAMYGAEINKLKKEIEGWISAQETESDLREPFDVTAPFPTNSDSLTRNVLLPSQQGSIHPLMKELRDVVSIFSRMGFSVVESREIDDDYHMFGALNFPEGHPARDDYDTFMTTQRDKKGKQFIAPAHTSTMQNRVLRQFASNLKNDEPIAVIIPDRVFRNEDLDARHEHTFYQLEGIYVGKGIHAGNLIATLKVFLQEYYQQELEVKTQPFYFPFTEPSFEFALSCPFCKKKGCSVCSHTGWIELLGCGMIHPNVLKEAGIDPKVYTGFAWGGGIDRLVMMKYDIEDIRHFESGKLEFLRQFV